MELTADQPRTPPIITSCPQRVAAVEHVNGRGGRGDHDMVRDLDCDLAGWSLDSRSWREHEKSLPISPITCIRLPHIVTEGKTRSCGKSVSVYHLLLLTSTVLPWYKPPSTTTHSPSEVLTTAGLQHAVFIGGSSSTHLLYVLWTFMEKAMSLSRNVNSLFMSWDPSHPSTVVSAPSMMTSAESRYGHGGGVLSHFSVLHSYLYYCIYTE